MKEFIRAALAAANARRNAAEQNVQRIHAQIENLKVQHAAAVREAEAASASAAALECKADALGDQE